MNEFSIHRVLRDALDLASAHRAALATYVLIGVVVPNLLLGSEPIFSMRALLAVAVDPYTYRLSGSIAGPLYLLGIVTIIVTGARMAAIIALQAGVRDGLLSEIMTGIVSGNLLLLAYLLFYLLILLLFGESMLLLLSPISPALASISFLLLFLGAGVWLRSRMVLTAPDIARTGSINPFPAMFASFITSRQALGKLFVLTLMIELALGVTAGLLAIGHIKVILAYPAGTPLEWGFTIGWAILFAGWFLALVLIPLAASRELFVADVSETFV